MTLILLPIDLKTVPRSAAARNATRAGQGAKRRQAATPTQTQPKVLLDALRAKDLI